MHDLATVAPAFVDMAHRIVWASAASVGPDDRPRSRVLHPIWEWDGRSLTGWVATAPTPLKREHLDHSPHMSFSYWNEAHDTCVAECTVSWILDDEGRRRLWERLSSTPEPVGYDPTMIPGWDSPTVDAFAGIRLSPWRLRVMPGSMLAGEGGEVLTWRSPAA